MIKKIIHRIKHLLKINKGKVFSWYEGDVLVVAFKCECGKILEPLGRFENAELVSSDSRTHTHIGTI